MSDSSPLQAAPDMYCTRRLSRKDFPELKGIVRHFTTAHSRTCPSCFVRVLKEQNPDFLCIRLFIYTPMSQLPPFVAKTTNDFALYICSSWWCFAEAAECERQTVESELRRKYCAKGQTRDDKSSSDGWASLLKVGPSLPSGTVTKARFSAMQTPVWTSSDSYLITGRGKKKTWLF